MGGVGGVLFWGQNHHGLPRQNDICINKWVVTTWFGGGSLSTSLGNRMCMTQISPANLTLFEKKKNPEKIRKETQIFIWPRAYSATLILYYYYSLFTHIFNMRGPSARPREQNTSWTTRSLVHSSINSAECWLQGSDSFTTRPSFILW